MFIEYARNGRCSKCFCCPTQTRGDLLPPARLFELWLEIGDRGLHRGDSLVGGRLLVQGVAQLATHSKQLCELTLPPVELDMSGLPDHMPPVADQAVKFDEELGTKYSIEARVVELPDELRAKLQKVAIAAYRALRVRDYGRVDLRLTEAGEIYVLEVNAGCYLEKNSEFATAAAATGIDYPSLINRIVDLAVERYHSFATPPAVPELAAREEKAA